MDSEHWISRLAAAKRYYAAQLGHIDDMPGMGMEEVEMEMEDDGDMEMEMEMALGDASWPEVACPYCYEDHDVASLCGHLEEEHPFEPHAAPAVTRSLWWQQAQNEEKDRFVTGSPWDWTDHELAILKEGLASGIGRYAREPNIMRYIKIAARLLNRTIRDVAL